MWKIWNIHTVGNLIVNIYWNFYKHDIIVTEVIVKTQSVQYFLFSQNKSRVKHIESNEQWPKKVQQAITMCLNNKTNVSLCEDLLRTQKNVLNQGHILLGVW